MHIVTGSFTAHQLRFECEVLTPVHLHAHKGSALRGALFHALRGDEGQSNGFCINKPELFCHRCPHHTACPISALLATVDDDSARGVDVPRPYTIEPPVGAQTVYQPGERLDFGLTLFARALDLFPYVIVGVRDLEEGGIGLSRPQPGSRSGWDRGRFAVRRIVAVNPLTRQERPVLQAGDDLVSVPDIPITDAQIQAVATLTPEVERLTLEFLTPLRLIDQGRLVQRIAFLPFLLRLLERMEALSVRYSGQRLAFDHAQLLPAAEQVTVLEDATRWVELESYSTRRQARSPMGGLVGSVTFGGPLAPFVPWLLWGQFTHVGKDAVKGNGLYRMDARG
jgi:hypothetical protein